ncbi:MAG TPA: maleylpyruvate isomerase family mycothiol-dependent enzyme [Acidimicrobiales bacterium]|nr:maleylpyruvate isomerase family mycothiol-dependent enzyme [Acidimicrobiales bacterium]
MEVATWIETLRDEGARMTAAARATSADAPVPTCPEWMSRDLIRHTGGIHRWATRFVAEARAEPGSQTLEEVAGGWPGNEELADWFEAGYIGLVAALEAAPPDLQCWTFLPAPSPLAMWSRRQAHETAIHRVDAELTAGRTLDHLSPFTPAFAADGVDELLTCFVPRRSTGLKSESPATLGIECADDEGAWVLTIGPHGVTTTAGATSASGQSDCIVRGAAGDLSMALWNRGRDKRLQVNGDRAVLDLFGDAVQVRWS